MSEEKDNLPLADGASENQQQDTAAENPQTTEPLADAMKAEAEKADDDPIVAHEETGSVETAPIKEDVAVEPSEPEETHGPGEALIAESESGETEEEAPNVVTLTDEEVADDSLVTEDNSELLGEPDPVAELVKTANDDADALEKTETSDAVAAISESNAADGEDESIAARHEIPVKDYEAMSMEQLEKELEELVSAEKVMSVKDHVEQVRSAFLNKYYHFIDEKREEWKNENTDPTEEFEYDFPLKHKFDKAYNLYRDKKNAHFKNIQNNLEANLKNRLALVEELKELLNPQENMKDALKHFNDIRERWKNAGPIPKDKYNHVWNNYHFHLENFYDYLHLDREARDLDFRHNLEQKQKIVARAEELVNETDVTKAFRELQDLHRIWKEEIGPVSREHREEIWNKFSELTRLMHDKREALYESQRGKETENLEKKKDIIARIDSVTAEPVTAHSQWQGQIDKIEALRNEFFATGKVPADVNEQTWSEFKTAVRNFNVNKNSFYKDIKKEQQDNLNKKMALVEKARSLQESEDFGATTPIMKQIQEEWKTIGHVPRKYSDKVWKEFREACNHYFEKLKTSRNESSEEETAAYENKKNYLEELRSFEMTGVHKTDLDAIKAHIEKWKTFGKVAFNKRHIEGKFNKVLDALFEKLSLSKKDSDMARFSNRIESLSASDDTRKLDNEKIFLMRKIEEVQSEIFQLENNIQFFANAKKDNPMVAEVRKNIERHKEELLTLKDKLKQLKNLQS